MSTFGTSLPAAALTSRIAICGRVTSFVDEPTPGDDIVRLGTQEPRRLILGSGVPQIGQEICVFGIDVENVNRPAPDPVPKGIVGYRIVPVASVGCANPLTPTTASFVMPGQEFEAPQNVASLRLPLSVPAGSGCVRIAVDAEGNPVAVVVPRSTASSPGVSSPTPQPSVVSLPSTSASVDFGGLAFALVSAGGLASVIGLRARRRSRRCAIPS